MTLPLFDRSAVNALFPLAGPTPTLAPAPVPVAEATPSPLPEPTPEPAPEPTPAQARPAAAPSELERDRVGRRLVGGEDVFVLPDGAFFPASDLGPCRNLRDGRVCGRVEFELVRRRVEIRSDKRGGESTWRQSFAVLCPECLPIDADGLNVHRRVEGRDLLGWVDGRTGEITWAEDEGESR